MLILPWRALRSQQTPKHARRRSHMSESLSSNSHPLPVHTSLFLSALSNNTELSYRL